MTSGWAVNARWASEPPLAKRTVLAARLDLRARQAASTWFLVQGAGQRGRGDASCGHAHGEPGGKGRWQPLWWLPVGRRRRPLWWPWRLGWRLLEWHRWRLQEWLGWWIHERLGWCLEWWLGRGGAAAGTQGPAGTTGWCGRRGFGGSSGGAGEWSRRQACRGRVSGLGDAERLGAFADSGNEGIWGTGAAGPLGGSGNRGIWGTGVAGPGRAGPGWSGSAGFTDARRCSGISGRWNGCTPARGPQGASTERPWCFGHPEEIGVCSD